MGHHDEHPERVAEDRVKASGESSSKWPPDVLALFGGWRDEDFPDAKNLRAHGADLPRETL